MLFERTCAKVLVLVILGWPGLQDQKKANPKKADPEKVVRITKRLDEAKATYKNTCDRLRGLREQLLKKLDAAIRKAQEEKKLELVEKLQAEKEAFDTKGVLPLLIDASEYLKQLEKARASLKTALGRATESYTQVGETGIARLVEKEIKLLDEGENVAGVMAETKIEPKGPFTPRLTSKLLAEWSIGTPDRIRFDRKGVTLGPGNYLITQSINFRATHLRAVVAATPGTEAYLVLRLRPNPNGWDGVTSLIIDSDERIRAGMAGLDFRQNEDGRKRQDFGYSDFFMIDFHINADMGVGVEVNGKPSMGVRFPEDRVARNGAAGVFVKSGSLEIRSLTITE